MIKTPHIDLWFVRIFLNRQRRGPKEAEDLGQMDGSDKLPGHSRLVKFRLSAPGNIGTPESCKMATQLSIPMLN